MVYNPYEILGYIAHSFTLDAGDVVLTGTPVGSGLLNDGDEVKVEIEGIGSITNYVERAEWQLEARRMRAHTSSLFGVEVPLKMLYNKNILCYILTD